MQATILLLGILLGLVLAYDLHNLLVLRRLHRQRRASPPASAEAIGTPPVDIVIPVYNMGSTLERTLDSIAASRYPHKCTIVVDDGSDDGVTPQILERLSGRIDLLERIPHQGKAAAANRGAELGGGEVILFLDADSHVRADFIERSLAELQGGIEAVDFVQQVANPDDSLWTRLAGFEREILTLVPDNFGALFAMTRPAFERFRFRDCLSPQFEINERLRRAGKLAISAEKVVYSDEPARLGSAYRRKRRWAYGWLESQRMHGRAMDHHLLMPVLDVLLVGLGLLAPIWPLLAVFPLAILGTWAAKSLLLARMLGLPARLVPGYALYMLMVSAAVVEAALRFRLGRRVAWR